MLGFQTASFADDDEVAGPDIQAEISRLEARMWKGALSSDETMRLGEIYFMTSRCEDIARLFASKVAKAAKADGTLLTCACGGKCAAGSEESSINQFRQLLDKGASWRDTRVQKLWKHVKDRPEAAYWAVKALRHGSGAPTQTVRVDLEKSLESLEVNP